MLYLTQNCIKLYLKLIIVMSRLFFSQQESRQEYFQCTQSLRGSTACTDKKIKSAFYSYFFNFNNTCGGIKTAQTETRENMFET